MTRNEDYNPTLVILDVVNHEKNVTGTTLLEDGCVRHDSACIPWGVGASDWMRRLSMTREVTDAGQSCKSFHRYRFGAMLHA